MNFPPLKLGISTALHEKRIFPARLDVKNMKMAAEAGREYFS